MKKILTIYSIGLLAMAILAVILVITKQLPGKIGDTAILIGGILFAVLSFVFAKKYKSDIK